MGAFFINYATEHWHGVTNQHASYLLSIAMISFMVGRFFSTWLMGRVQAATLLMVYSLVTYRALRSGDDEYRRRVSGGADCSLLFMSIMFPTIFALGVKKYGQPYQTRQLVYDYGHRRRGDYAFTLWGRWPTATAPRWPKVAAAMLPGGAVVRHEPTTRVSGKIS